MPLRFHYFKKTFHFNFEAWTSRGVMQERFCWFIKIFDDSVPGKFGLGEVAPLLGLSAEGEDQVETQLGQLANSFQHTEIHECNKLEVIHQRFKSFNLYSSVWMGLEMALLDFFYGCERIVFPSDFLNGIKIPINGLIWMGGVEFMVQQINTKIEEGYTCLKIKVGSLDFEKECEILQYIRQRYTSDQISIRLDANGAFKPEEVMVKLSCLAQWDIHSIEQPVKAGQWELMRRVCRESPIPIALDEELIGLGDFNEKEKLLYQLKPRFIVLKPSLHGGFHACQEWIRIAEGLSIQWWITSALESSVGLNAIAQFSAQYKVSIPQGLGTGGIFLDNIGSPLYVSKGYLRIDPAAKWDIR